MGGTGAGSDTDLFPTVLNNVLGTKIKLVTGFPTGFDINLAMEQGVIEGRCGWSWSSIRATRKNLVSEKKIRILLQLAVARHKDLPDVPVAAEFAATRKDRETLNLFPSRQPWARPLSGRTECAEDRRTRRALRSRKPWQTVRFGKIPGVSGFRPAWSTPQRSGISWRRSTHTRSMSFRRRSGPARPLQDADFQGDHQGRYGPGRNRDAGARQPRPDLEIRRPHPRCRQGRLSEKERHVADRRRPDADHDRRPERRPFGAENRDEMQLHLRGDARQEDRMFPPGSNLLDLPDILGR